MTTANEILPAFFLSDDPDEVIAAAAQVERMSSGCVNRTETYNRRTNKPERGGIHCARVFGPIADNRCICEKLCKPEHVGQICDRCGVLCGPARLRHERWGHIESDVPLFHPILVPRIAQRLNCRQDDLVAALRRRANLHPDGTVVHTRRDTFGMESFADPAEEAREHRGNRYFAERLEQAGYKNMLIHRVPVTPSQWRTTPRDPQDAGYLALVNRCNRLARLIELSAPKIILDNEERMTQIAFMRLGEVVRDELVARANRRPRAPETDASRELLRQIRETPDDDKPRLAYANYLRERDDPRGDFLAMQLETPGLSRMPKPERDLLRWHYNEWLDPLTAAVDKVVFRRGFLVSCRTIRARALGLVGDPAWATVEHLDSDIVELIAHPCMRALREISVNYRTLRALCGRDDVVLPKIIYARVRLTSCPPQTPKRVVDNTVLPELRELELHHTNPRGHQDWSWLFDTTLADRLESLAIQSNIERLELLQLAQWVDVLLRHPRLLSLTLAFSKRTCVIELRRGTGDETVGVDVRLSRLFDEMLSLGNEELLDHLETALMSLEPHSVGYLRIKNSAGFYADRHHGLAASLRGVFGQRVSLPRFRES